MPTQGDSGLGFPSSRSGDLARALIIRRTGWVSLMALLPTLAMLLLGGGSSLIVFWLPVFLTLAYHRLAARRFARELATHHYRLCCGCAYDLHDHPDSGRCPECGELYDVLATRREWTTIALRP